MNNLISYTHSCNSYMYEIARLTGLDWLMEGSLLNYLLDWLMEDSLLNYLLDCLMEVLC